MDLVTLATTAITLVSPYLIKSGEKIAENVGEEIWNFVKKPFTSEKELKILENINEENGLDIFKTELINKLSQNPEFAIQLQDQMQNAQTQLMQNNAQQNIQNNSTVTKQINIQQNSGNIQM